VKDTEFAYAVAYIRTLENKMLTQQDLDALLLADSYASALHLLSEKGYRDAEEKPLDVLLKNELERAWETAREVYPAEAPIDVLLYQNDFHNLKTILKANAANQSWQELVLSPSVCDPQLLADAIREKQFGDLPDFLQEPAEASYQILTEYFDGQLMEIAVDRFAYLAMKQRAKQEKNDFLIGWVERNILCANLEIALRASHRTKEFLEGALIPCTLLDTDALLLSALEGRESVISKIADAGYPQGADAATESLGKFNQWCAHFLMDYLKIAKQSCFGFEPILAFLVAKQREIQSVRIILSGKFHEMDVKIIKERLRDLYV